MPDAPSCVRYWRRWRGMPGDQRRLLVALLVLLPAVNSAIGLFGVRRVQGGLARLARHRPFAAVPNVAEAKALGGLVDLAARHTVGQPACLVRSITLWWFLRRQGMDADLRIGVRTCDGALEAHAWVEYAGCVLNDSNDVAHRFAPFDGLHLPASWSKS